jgi:hypothetical protein
LRHRLPFGFPAPLFLAGSVFMLVQTLRQPFEPLGDWLAGAAVLLLFVAAGLYGSFPLLRIPWDTRRTICAITDHHLLIIDRTAYLGGVQSFERARITCLERRDCADGSGDIVFHRYDSPLGAEGPDIFGNRVGFFGVPDVRRLEAEVRRVIFQAP